VRPEAGSEGWGFDSPHSPIRPIPPGVWRCTTGRSPAFCRRTSTAVHKASRFGRLFIPYDDKGVPLSERVARHLEGIAAVLESLVELEPNKAVGVEGLPGWRNIMEKGVGTFFRPAGVPTDLKP